MWETGYDILSEGEYETKNDDQRIAGWIRWSWAQTLKICFYKHSIFFNKLFSAQNSQRHFLLGILDLFYPNCYWKVCFRGILVTVVYLYFVSFIYFPYTLPVVLYLYVLLLFGFSLMSH